jgi:hypothetical protein
VTEPELPPAAVTVEVSTSVDTVTVSWSSATSALSYRVDLVGTSTLTKNAEATATTAQFTGADGVTDGESYTVTVYAINTTGETASSNTPTATADYFPWDEYFETSLHRTGAGKQTFYNEVPNGGFEQYTNIPYQNLVCQGCHEPGFGGTVKGERGCLSCHDTDNPQLGADVDATLTGACGTCHGRQKAEAIKHGISDVHRDAGMDCMSCHTLGDVHGDGNAYVSMLDEGAIDANCGDCHTSVGNNIYHTTHMANIDCTACHTQSVVTCNNCHFETEVEAHKKVAYGQFKNWKFLLNRDGKVAIGNYQSVTYNGRSVVAFGPYYAHTIDRNAVTSCTDCHSNPNVDDWFADGVIDVVVWDETLNNANGRNLTHATGFIPVPPNYKEGGMRFDFVDLDQPDGTIWSFLKTGADIFQILYSTPLTQAQMEAIK